MVNLFPLKKRTALSAINFSLIFILSVFLVSLVSCGKKHKSGNKDIEYTEDTARIISHLTSGIISSGDRIYLRFVDPVIKEENIGKKIKSKVFSFKPRIKGISKWEDRRTIIFIPDSRLPFHEEYSAKADLKMISSAFDKLLPVDFSFKTAGREIKTLFGEFFLVNENNPDNLKYTGEIGFTGDIKFETVKDNLSFISQSGEIPLLWSEKSAGRKFVFTSKTIPRKKKGENFIIKINKSGTGISEDVVKKIRLEPLTKFKIANVIKFDKGQEPGLEIRFSHKLKKGQDIKGLVSIDPPMKISLKTIGKSIFVGGDFKFGEQYSAIIKGIRSKWGGKIEKEIKRSVVFEDKKPQISFSSTGIYLPSSENRKIGFRTMNVKKVKIVVKKVFESNLGQFLQEESLSGNKNRNSGFDYYEMNRVGVKVAEQDLSIGNVKNRWLNNQLDMRNLIAEKDKGLFIIELSFKRKDMLYSGLKKKAGYYSGKNYYSNPNSYGYIYRHGDISKPVLVSDIGLTYKRGGGEHFVFATNLIDSSPMSGVKITLRTFQNQELASGETDGDGKLFLQKVEGEVFFVEAEKSGQRSIIKPSEMGWNLSSFDTGGVISRTDSTRAFIYTERGVYRPGDPINLSVIARNNDGSFPENHPATLELFNPRNQLVKKIVEKNSIDGFYNFKLKTSENDLTGNWRAKLTLGSSHFFHTLKIETVVPFRLKVRLDPGKTKLNSSDDSLKLALSSNYLFGSPSPFLDTEISVLLRHIPRKFKKFKKYSFSNELRSFKSSDSTLFEGKLDENGKVQVVWKIPNLTNVPSSLRAEITAKVFEKGGRATTGNAYIPIDPYRNYIGLERPSFKYGYSKVGSPVNINSILVTSDGEPISGRPLKYKIYRNARYWWWEYDNLESFRIRYKKDDYTKIVKEGNITSKNTPIPIIFTPEQSGEYFIEVEEDMKEGHKAGFFFSSYFWGESPSNIKDAGSLILTTDRKKYKPGDTALISFPKPEKGTLLVTLEKGDRILRSWVRELKGEDAIGEIKIDVTDKMLPNAYVSVSIVQPHAQTGNDRPLRVYGTIPLMVEEPSTRKNIIINMDDELKSNKEFEISVRTKDKSDVQFTIAVVDEGLLDLTKFNTPDPWKSFFSKQKLGISTFDLFSYVLSVNKGDIFRLFSIGGEMEEGMEEYRSSQLEPGKSKRFKAVSMFLGPLRTGKKGEKKVKFRMPDYIGSVRVMVIAADHNSFGKAEKNVPVKTDLMLLPTLPRVLGPGDIVEIPITVFALNEKIRNVNLSIKTEGDLKVLGKNKKKLVFKETGEKDTSFKIKVENAVGNCKVIFKGESGKFKISRSVDLKIRPSSPRIYESEKKNATPGKSIDFLIPDKGLKGTNRASIVISRKSKLDLEDRLSWLIHYPYGCIEQTVSSVFPQLYLKEFVKDSSIDMDNVDDNINSAIKRLRKFMLPSGGLSYWPGNRDASIWGTNYGLHFIVEAKKRGYNIPNDLINSILRFQRSRALVTTDHMLSRIYRLYVLALAGKPQIGPMNLIMENDLKKTTNVERWMLSAAYYLAGKKSVSKKIRKGIETTVSEYKDHGRTFGSSLRDRGIVLEALTLFQDWNKADLVYEEIVRNLSDRYWYSTQTLGYSLLALGKYMLGNKMDFRGDDTPINGYILMPGNKKQTFDFDGLKHTVVIQKGFGKKLTIFIGKKVKLGKVYVTLQWNGIPLKSLAKDLSKNLSLDVTWLNEDGRIIDPAFLKQGTVFWGHFKVRPGPYAFGNLTELALVQVIPAGWEIENTRLSGEENPLWMSEWKLGREMFTDIRDDRIMWFFDMPGKNTVFDFVLKLNCVSSGKFILPPTIFESMYNNNYRAVKKGMRVEVVSKQSRD